MEQILIIDQDDGIIVATKKETILTPHDGLVDVYKYKEYYHSLDDALKDLYGIDKTI